MTEVVAFCEQCDWRPVVTEPEGGQSLFGTLGGLMARHSGTTGHDRMHIDWEATEVIK